MAPEPRWTFALPKAHWGAIHGRWGTGRGLAGITQRDEFAPASRRANFVDPISKFVYPAPGPRLRPGLGDLLGLAFASHDTISAEHEVVILDVPGLRGLRCRSLTRPRIVLRVVPGRLRLARAMGGGISVVLRRRARL